MKVLMAILALGLLGVNTCHARSLRVTFTVQDCAAFTGFILACDPTTSPPASFPSATGWRDGWANPQNVACTSPHTSPNPPTGALTCWLIGQWANGTVVSAPMTVIVPATVPLGPVIGLLEFLP